MQSLDLAIADRLCFIRVFGTMFMIFGFVALFLASVGLYAVMSFSVSRRTREVGIRMTLGARGGDVVRMIFAQGLWQLGIGITAGLAFAVALAQVMTVVLFYLQPRDPVILTGVAAVLTAVGSSHACFLLFERRASILWLHCEAIERRWRLKIVRSSRRRRDWLTD
ncbi:MAG TPA: FtsX-like permease family protein [Gemmatimonadaceae bacterium]|nr:FtsX-like permease family protein [Gemmatimonadaceae bacterium]